jgi:hypothetical protein
MAIRGGTLRDDEGSNVSAGEMQRLTIARAFLAKPSGASWSRETRCGYSPRSVPLNAAQFAAPIADEVSGGSSTAA